MKNFKLLLALAIGLLIGMIITKLSLNYGLGTEYREWEKQQQLIEKQNNSIKFIWEGLEKDIPKDGDQLINLSTNENIVYLNPVD